MKSKGLQTHFILSGFHTKWVNHRMSSVVGTKLSFHAIQSFILSDFILSEMKRYVKRLKLIHNSTIDLAGKRQEFKFTYKIKIILF